MCVGRAQGVAWRDWAKAGVCGLVKGQCWMKGGFYRWKSCGGLYTGEIMSANSLQPPSPVDDKREQAAAPKPPSPWPMRWVISAVAVFILVFNVYYFLFA